MARPSSLARSTTTERLDRLSSSNTGLVGMSPPSIRWNVRDGSPAGGSILITSAPQSLKIPPPRGRPPHPQLDHLHAIHRTCHTLSIESGGVALTLQRHQGSVCLHRKHLPIPNG